MKDDPHTHFDSDPRWHCRPGAPRQVGANSPGDLAGARDPEAFDRAIDVRITRIRRKIEPDADRPAYIKTVRGAGYMFMPEGEAG